MKWLSGDFERERKMKKKFAFDMAKASKKNIETRHLEVDKIIKRQEQDLKKRTLLMSRSVNNYWKKIEKLTKHNYNILLQENKSIQQHNRLLNFINKLQKISSRVAQSLPGKIQDGYGQGLMGVNPFLKDENNNKINTFMDDDNISNFNNITSTNDNDNTINNNNEENFIAQAAQCAESFLPTGIELAQCKIDTQVPFLLKNDLREYQLIGLHWLRALHDNKINGILADEMGLGKTIQTISLIAHLACNKGIWGPHLIIVPTTIIINWEIEFKKWCPSLKILSYYGNQKERKAKRMVNKNKYFNF
jgi:SNF2 family DNA or RNA helicase